MAFLTQNHETLSPRMSNPFWTQVLERWKVIRPKLYHNQDDLIHTNICNSTKTSFTILIPPYRYIPLSLIVDHDLNILPPSELDHRIPLTDWAAIKPLTILMATSNLRHKINKSSLTGNFEPFYPPELQITNPNLKGCKLFFNALSNHSFESKHWAKFNQFQSDHELAPEILEKQIIKLNNTSRAIEAKDLQYRVLRNTCITNNKLYHMKILDTPKCTLCNHPTQDSTHRFYYCPQAQETWQLLTNITSQTPHPHYFSFTTAILNVLHLPRNHPLIILTNITRQFIDKAHSNSISIHPNTILHKILNHAEIFASFEARNESVGNAGRSSRKFSEIWSSIAESCRGLLKPKNPQTLPLDNP